MSLQEVRLDRIVAGDNDRTSFADAELRSLADSIARDGLAQPPTLRHIGRGRYQLVAGERRVRAMRLLGWETAMAFVRDLDDDAAANIMLVENMVRVDLDPIEEARAYAKRVDAGSTPAGVARVIGRSERHVAARIALLGLSPAAQHLIATGSLSAALAAHMVGLDADRQALALKALRDGSLTQAAFRSVCARLHREQEAQPLFDAESFWSVEDYVATAQEETRAAPLVQLLDVTRRLAAACPDSALADQARALLAEHFASGTNKMPFRLRLDGSRPVSFKTRAAAEEWGARQVNEGKAQTYEVEEVHA